MSKNPQRILKGRYQVVPRTIIILIRDDEVLLQKGPETKMIFPGYYNGIGGHVERGENVFHGAVRELNEEAGINCDDLALAGTIVIDVEDEQGILLFVFTGQKVTGELIESDEGSLHWIKIQDLKDIKVVDDLPELVQQILHYRASGKIFHGSYQYDDDGVRHTRWSN